VSRHLLTLAILLGLPAFAVAQPGKGNGGGQNPPTFLPISPVMPGISPVMPPLNPIGGGKPGKPIFPFPPVWGGWIPYGYGYAPPVIVVQVPTPVPVGPPPPPERVVVISNEFPAVLVLEFPAAAEVWVNGAKAEGEPTSEWTLTSPVLKADGEFTFEVKARWKSGGKTFEAERSVVVAGGKRSRAIVVAGTEVKE
jgi:uncharacterized protein (TIGR03000 family)